jgi:hypothetical protein
LRYAAEPAHTPNPLDMQAQPLTSLHW